jgi:DNA-binding NarL/FixJ family response regulator
VVDINMTPMDGFETTKRLKELYPEIKVLALSMLDEGFSVRKMLSNGAKGFLHKNTSAEELDQALKTIYSGAYFHSGLVSDDVLERAMSLYPLSISNRETEFLALCCTELAYKQIAEQMQISMHTVEGYRKQLFQKLNVKNRTSLAIYALKTGIASF